MRFYRGKDKHEHFQSFLYPYSLMFDFSVSDVSHTQLPVYCCCVVVRVSAFADMLCLFFVQLQGPFDVDQMI